MKNTATAITIIMCLMTSVAIAQDLNPYKSDNGKYGYKDASGNEVIFAKFNYAMTFSEGLACVKLNDKWGFIDHTGQEAFPIQYEDAGSFSDGLAAVKLDGKFGFVDKTGKEVIVPKYNSVFSFSGGLALVKQDGRTFSIDKTGNEVVVGSTQELNSFSGVTDKNLKTQETGTFIDSRDGNIYTTVKIGDQEWMSQNLAYKTNDGSWAYDNNVNNVAVYGYLYNWQTANLVAPPGWHLATNDEWLLLIDYMGGRDVAGKKLKSITGWGEYAGTNEMGFAGLPGGKRSKNESFYEMGKYSNWWTATSHTDARVAHFIGLGSFISNTTGGLEDKQMGFTVRCIKD